MDTKRIELALKAYEDNLNEKDFARLTFFKGLWDIQNRHVDLVTEADIYEIPDAKTAEEWYWQEKPFFMMAPVSIDEDRFIAAIEDCVCYLVDHAGLKEEVAESLRFFGWRDLIAETDLKQAGYDPMAYVESCCELVQKKDDQSVAADILSLVLSCALRPMLQSAAEATMKMLSPALKEGNDIHDKPLCCPACGGEAVAAYVGETPSSQGNGRLLYCGMCGTEWEFERIRCGHCGTRNQGHLHYFHLEGDETHRLHNCQECGDYLRTVFQDDLIAPFSFVVEDVVMTRLDMVAHDPRFSDELNQQADDQA